MRLSTRHLILLIISGTVSCWALAIAESVLASDTVVPEDTLQEVLSFGGRTGEYAIGQPGGLQILPSGNLLIADIDNSRLMEFTPTGSLVRTVGSIGSGEMEFSEPQDLVATQNRVYVADWGNRRIVIMDSDCRWLSSIKVDYAVDCLLAARDGTIYAGSNYRKDQPTLFFHYDQSGKLLGTVGKTIGDSTEPWYVRAALNRVTAVQLDSSHFAVGFISVAHIVVGTDLDHPVTDWTLDTDVDPTRQWFFDKLPSVYKGRVASASGHQLSDYCRDIRDACQGKKRWVELISDVIPFQDRILVAVSSTIHEYDLSGRLRRRCVLLDKLGERAFAHRIALDSSGNLYALDVYHANLCHKYVYCHR
jgi:hypothetical protein